MNFFGVLIAFSIFTAVFSCYCATRNTDDSQNSKATWRKLSEHPHLHFVDQKHLAELNESRLHPVLFRLYGSGGDLRRHDASPKYIGMTLEDFEKCLPWIPYGNRILISSPGGFSPLLVKRLKHLHSNREFFLVKEDSGSSQPFQRREA